MRKHEYNITLPIMIAVITLPATLSLSYHNYTGDPTLRPLGVTLESLADHDPAGYSRGLIVQVDWGENTKTNNTPEQVKRTLDRALSVYNIDYRIQFNRTGGGRIKIFFLVNSSQIGPYKLSNVAAGIRPALAAYKLSKRN